jgi:hypothetical protein
VNILEGRLFLLMPHELLEGRKAHVLIRFVCAEGVTQRMHTCLLANPGPLDVLGNRIALLTASEEMDIRSVPAKNRLKAACL